MSDVLATRTSRRAFTGGILGAAAARAASGPRVVAEETIYDYTPADNGAGPLWDYGAPGLVRRGDAVFAAGLDTVPEAKPLHNCRWAIHRRAGGKWQRVASDESGRQREPCPIGLFEDGRLIVSVNPTLTAPGTYSGPANPHLLAFNVRNLLHPPAVLRPAWSGEPRLSEHTYRGLGVDARRGELLVLHNDGRGTPRAHWAFLDRGGAWRSQGVIEYPIRGCYPQVALRNGAAHVLAVGDIVEPLTEWRKWKFEQTRRDWDYVFRRLYYVWSAAVATKPFGEVVEIANVDATAGHITNLDLWLAPDGAAHLLYLQRRVANRAMRDRFFPGVPLTVSLEHCIVRNGRVASRRTLLSAEEESGNELPAYARLHARSPGRLTALISTRADKLYRMRMVDVWPQFRAAGPTALATEHPMANFMTATERGGSRPSDRIDVMGIAAGERNTIRYALIQL
jgi:hypothetical protein